MLYLTLFIGGIIFAVLIIPFLQTLSERIFSMGELHKSKINVGIAQNNLIVNDMKAQYDKSNTHAIGFNIDSSEELYDDEECEPDECKAKPIGKIGFKIT
jgi:hypothetical protein